MFIDWIMTYGEDAQFVAFFAVLLACAGIEVLAPGRALAPRRRKRWRANFALTAVAIGVMGVLPVTFISVAASSADHRLGLFNQLDLPLALALIAQLLARGFISFATHWLMHKVPAFWRLHRVHHLDTALDVSTTVRLHPAELLVQLAIGVPMVIALGLSPWVLMLYEILDAGVTVFAHANISLPAWLERRLRLVIVTPDLHRVHHSAAQPETDSNFGAVLPFWDIVFGTYRARNRAELASLVLGLEEVRDARAHRIGWLLSSPWRAIQDTPRDQPRSPAGRASP